jgi:hypothetical protein
MNDPTFGMAHPWWVFSNDQVPICLSSECIMTVEDKGLDIVYDAAGKDLDTNHFCTLNLCGPMLLRDDKANQTKPHLVFRGAFKDGEDWRKKILNWEGTIFWLHWAPQGGDSQNMGGTVRQDHL